MEKFNAIKILEEELEDKKIFDNNLSKEHYMNSVYKYLDDFVEPILKRKISELNLQAPQELIDEITSDVSSDTNISNEDKKTMLKIETINLFYNDKILNNLKVWATQLVNELGFINEEDYVEEEFEEDDIRSFLEKDEVCFLVKDKKTKEKVANRICKTLINMLKNDLEEDTKSSRENLQ